jgi:hypothetical protein
VRRGERAEERDERDGDRDPDPPGLHGMCIGSCMPKDIGQKGHL